MFTHIIQKKIIILETCISIEILSENNMKTIPQQHNFFSELSDILFKNNYYYVIADLCLYKFIGEMILFVICDSRKTRNIVCSVSLSVIAIDSLTN